MSGVGYHTARSSRFPAAMSVWPRAASATVPERVFPCHTRVSGGLYPPEGAVPAPQEEHSMSRWRTLVMLVLTLTAPVAVWAGDRKSTRLNSSHQIISYAVFCF